MSDAAAPPAPPRSAAGPLLMVSDALTMSGRCLRLSRRDSETLMGSVVLPVALLLVLVYLFGGAITIGADYLRYVVPGVLLLCAALGSALTAVIVCQDVSSGITDRFRAMGIGGASLLVGHVAASVARNAASAVLLLGVSYAVGFRADASPLAWLPVAGVLLAFVLAVSSLAVVAGLLVRSTEGVNTLVGMGLLAPFVSSAFVPVSTMPSWLHGFADNQPVAPVVDTVRRLLLDQSLGWRPWQALAWCGGIALVSTSSAVLLFRRRTA